MDFIQLPSICHAQYSHPGGLERTPRKLHFLFNLLNKFRISFFWHHKCVVPNMYMNTIQSATKRLVSLALQSPYL